MTETFIEMTEEEFDDQHALIPNHLNPNATWSFGDECGRLFETYGEEVEFVRRYDPAKVWTIVDGDDGDMYVISGLHFVNRIGYLLSREPVPEGTTVEVHIPIEMYEDEDERFP